MQFTSPYWAKSLTKFNQKFLFRKLHFIFMNKRDYELAQDFRRVVDLNCKQKENWTT